MNPKKINISYYAAPYKKITLTSLQILTETEISIFSYYKNKYYYPDYLDQPYFFAISLVLSANAVVIMIKFSSVFLTNSI